MDWAILVIWGDGTEEYVKNSLGKPALFSRNGAQRQVEFMKIGMEEDCQSINIVRFRERARNR